MTSLPHEIQAALTDLRSRRATIVAQCGAVTERWSTLRTVLLVEDDLPTCRAMHRVLSPICDIVIVNSGEEAQKVLAERAVALVIVDLGLPGISGVDFASRLGPAVLLLSAADDESIMMAAKASHADAWLSKTGDNSELVKTVERLLSERAAR